jgi:hypothetical protein
MFRTTLLATVAALAGFSAQAEPFTFVALGDAPYGDPVEVYPQYETLIKTINLRAPKLVLHVGDIKSGSTLCSDELILQQLTYMNTFAAPVLYTPGDNEWTDCHRKKAGKFDPLERLAFVRKNFFPTAKTLGTTPMDVTSMAADGYPENARLVLNDVMFVTASVPGSNNNFEIRDMAAITEFMARDAANLKWLEDSFAAAKDAKALVLGIQANMFEANWHIEGEEVWSTFSGYANFGAKLVELSAAFGKPVLLVYGDSHVYGEMRPFPMSAPNVLALEVPGEKMMDAVEVTVDPATSAVFSTMFIQNPALVQN